MQPWQKEKLLQWYNGDITRLDMLKEEGDRMLNEEFRHALAKEFTIDPDNLKKIDIQIAAMTAPRVVLTVQLTPEQVKALHWIKESPDG